MSTNSHIAVKQQDGSVLRVYCHWDGYLEWNGKILALYYNSPELAQLLVTFGDISSLDKHISPSGNTHTFNNREPGVTVFYGRDRGEQVRHAVKFNTFEEFKRSINGEPYTYYFDGSWKHINDNGKVQELAELVDLTEA